MSKISPLNPHKLIKVLQKAGFRILRQKGSHIIMIDDKETRVVIPVHPGKDVKPGLTRAIIKEAGLSREEFLKLLKEA
ncbi:MAG: type II toxin-antitoxin system HicA family toxin [Candidatus Bathyarchaeia archaeon]